MTEARKPFFAKCRTCDHVWPIAYAPMELTLFAQVLIDARCPMCGADAKQITPAKQKDGVLLEDGAPQHGAQGT